MINGSEYVPVECVNIPKMLFQEKPFEKLSADAKLLYSLLLDRKNVARMNGWVDQYGTAYVIYPKSEMKKNLNASRYRVDMALDELEKCGQMVVVTQPNPGRPCQIYVKDITGNMMRDMEEKPMCMMMKDMNDKNGMPMMGPCMGIPGMQGVAVFFDPEAFMKAFETEDEETDQEEASAEDQEDMEQEIDYDYRDSAYYSLPRKKQRLIDMTYYGYIDENNVPDDKTIIGDATYLGKEIGEKIAYLAMNHDVDADRFFMYVHELYKAGKLNKICAIMKAIALLCGDLDEYVDAMECCIGYPKKLFMTGVCYISNKVAADILDGEDQE